MIIETKGTKTGVAQPDGAKKYASEVSATRSGTPYYLALAVASLAAYLRSLFGNPAHAETVAEEAPPQSRGSPKLVALTPSDPEPDDRQPEARVTGSSGPVPQPEAPAPEYDSPTFLRNASLHFATPDPQPNLNDFKASPVIPTPENDNGGGSPKQGGGGGAAEKASVSGNAGHSPGSRGAANGAASPVEIDPSGPAHSTGSPAEPGGSEASDPGHPREALPDPGQGSAVANGTVDPSLSDRTPTGGVTAGPEGRRNRAPISTGTVHLADATGGALLAIAMTDLLRNVEDPDGDPLSVRDVSVSSGALAHDGDGWMFDGREAGPVTITYEVTDGEFSITQTASLNVVERNHATGSGGGATILATPSADRVEGGTHGDAIDARTGADLTKGGAGGDHIVAGPGDDTVLGGGGDDVILAGSGADVVSGGTGDDRIFGEAGDDILFGDGGDDRLEGGDGRDILMGSTGSDVLFGDAGDDRLDGGEGDDLAFGGLGRDVVSGGAGDDRLEGGEGDDVLSDGSGRDLVLGQEGDDVIVVALDGNDDRFDGGAGEDTLDLSATTSGVMVDLAAGTAVGGEIGADAVTSVEVVLGGSGDDVLSGSSGGDTLVGGAGQDRISGGAGDDRLDGGSGADALFDGTGSDIVLGGSGDDVLTAALDGEADRFDGGTGEDTLDLSATTAGVVVDLAAGTAVGAETGRDVISGLEAVVGGSGADDLSGGTGGDRLSGGDGDDRIAGRSGDDLLEGGAGRDTILDGPGRDVVRSGAGDDRIVLAPDGDGDRVDGGEGSDTLDLGGATGDLLVDLVNHVVSGTEYGDDQVDSVERIVAGSGDDRFVIGDEDVVLTGGGGSDAYGFLPRTGIREPTRAVEITDFSVGDHVDLLNWALFEDGPGTGGKSLADAMERNDGTVSGIRYRSALLDSGDVTVISADLDRDDSFETTIVLDGHHTLVFIDAPADPAGANPASPTT